MAYYKMNKDWVRGKPPKGTYGWGAVILENADPRHGFRFASFGGDHVHLDRENGEEIPFEQIAYWTNPIEFPLPKEVLAAGEMGSEEPNSPLPQK